jgi:hypothetical protein
LAGRGERRHRLRLQRPNGIPVAAIMPTGFHEIVTQDDLDSIVAYLRTVLPKE